MIKDIQISSFTPSTPEDNDILHVKKGSGEDTKITYKIIKDNILASVKPPLKASQYPLLSTVAANNKIKVEDQNGVEYHTLVSTISRFVLDKVYPVGSIYCNAESSLSPFLLFGFGTWVAIRGRVLIGQGEGTDVNGDKEFFAAGATGGEYKHALSVAEMAPHNHRLFSNTEQGSANQMITATTDVVAREFNQSGNNDQYIMKKADVTTASVGASSSTGSGNAHNIMQPYSVVYMWRRVA